MMQFKCFSQLNKRSTFSSSSLFNNKPRFYTTANTKKQYDMKLSILEFPEQTVYAGETSLAATVNKVKSLPQKFKKPLIVTDRGVSSLKILDDVVGIFKESGFDPVVFDQTNSNPAVDDVKKIAKKFNEDSCDFCIGVGGGGPLDAMKGGMAIIAKQRTQSSFDIDKDGSDFMTSHLKPLLSKIPKEYAEAVPTMVAIPTTAGTGSEGGKSAVITDPNGVKFVFGNPAFFPKLVALSPRLTAKMPPQLTASTGIDALFHLLEAYFVTNKAAELDGLDPAGTARCDAFALEGADLVVRWLPKAFIRGGDIEARFHMQIAALLGAKAFRKGDLGGIHATAHALGAKYHLHHGTSIARMAVPVLKWNLKHADAEFTAKAQTVHKIFQQYGQTLDEAIENFLTSMRLEKGLSGLPINEKEIEKLAEMARKDGCQTNPIPLDSFAYLQIFTEAWKNWK